MPTLSCKAQENCAQRCQKLQLQNRDLDATAKKARFWTTFRRNFKGKITSAKIEKICWQITIAALMQPLQCDLRCRAAKDNSIVPAAWLQATLTQPLQCDLQRLTCKTQWNCAQRCQKLQLQNRDLDATAKKARFWTTFRRNFKGKITSAKIEKICWQITIAALMQPLHCDLRCRAAKDNSIVPAAWLQATLTQPLQCDLQRLTCKTQWNCAQRCQKLQLQNRDLDATAKKARFWTTFRRNFNFKGKITSAKIEKICWQITIAALMQPLQCDLRCRAAKDNSIVPAAWLQATLTQPLQCDLQRLTCKTQWNCAQRCQKLQLQNRDLDATAKKARFWTTFRRNFKGKITSAKIEKICWQITVAALVQPLQYDLRYPAAKTKIITHGAVTHNNLDAATALWSAPGKSTNA